MSVDHPLCDVETLRPRNLLGPSGRGVPGRHADLPRQVVGPAELLEHAAHRAHLEEPAPQVHD
eukprot:3595745-Pyramimonas_sp.AAC.1